MAKELEFTIGRDNTQKIKMSDTSSGSWAVADLSELTRAILVLEDFEIDSDVNPTAFVLGDDDGTITLKLGHVTGLSEGLFDSHLIIFRPIEPNGLSWKPSFKVRILSK